MRWTSRFTLCWTTTSVRGCTVPWDGPVRLLLHMCVTFLLLHSFPDSCPSNYACQILIY